ncbi:MAG TPA: adenylate/guanylate cyclase domain-containing protein, partial [Micromonosporaceae bacterium]|nr:adenylate/guanylate cyclase domain-containing protein [Micromonosporaceae bacterium]
MWTLHLALPLAGLWLLLGYPPADLVWHDSPSHFWLVLLVAAISLALGGMMSAAAGHRADAR